MGAKTYTITKVQQKLKSGKPCLISFFVHNKDEFTGGVYKGEYCVCIRGYFEGSKDSFKLYEAWSDYKYMGVYTALIWLIKSDVNARKQLWQALMSKEKSYMSLVDVQTQRICVKDFPFFDFYVDTSTGKVKDIRVTDVEFIKNPTMYQSMSYAVQLFHLAGFNFTLKTQSNAVEFLHGYISIK